MRFDPMDEKDFDSMLESTVADLPPNDIVQMVTPWKKAMHRVLIGFAVSSLTLNVWCLNHILPAVGLILMLLGFRTLHKENRWFNGCYAITILRCAYYYPMLILNATIYQKTFFESGWLSGLTVINLGLQFSLLLCLWQGIKAVQRKADVEEHAGGAVALMAWYLLICLLSMIGNVGLILAAIVIILYICAIRSLWKVARELDEAGYMIDAASVQVPDATVAGILAVLLAAGLVLAYIFGGTYSMDWQILERSENREITEIKAHLAELGFPEDILDDLKDEDILCLKGAKRIVMTTEDHAVNDGRRVTEKKKDANGYLSFYRYTVFDVKELRITGIAVELSEEDHWRMIHHFKWVEQPKYFGTESVQLWSMNSGILVGWQKVSEYSGQVLYDKDGVSYHAPYFSLGEETYRKTDFLLGSAVTTDTFAEFSFPTDGINQRGYISFTLKEQIEGYIFDCWINYTHQLTWAQYPAVTAKEQRMASAWNDDGAFKTVQDALQFYPAEKEETQN